MLKKARRFVCLFVVTSSLAVAKEGQDGGGIIPATPPVNVHTSAIESDYKGYGLMQFSIELPHKSTPEFTLGGDEDAEYEIGTSKYTAIGLVYVNEGKRRKFESSETAWLAGTLNSKLTNDTFTYSGVTFDVKSESSGLIAGKRSTTAKRLSNSNSLSIDYAYTSLWAFYNMSSSTRFTSRGTQTYIDDYDESQFGVAWRPMITIQPKISLGSMIDFIPFAGAASFLSLTYSSWEVNQWEDQNYGPDCFDGCPDFGLFPGIIPVETFVGFDLEIHFTPTSTLSLSSFLSAGITTETQNMSEVYIVYTQDI
ncbi:MAG: hypothetical protein OEZ47_03785 [Gammaproteobacteria bacterium]|nr:hypothetical protein [Gammaproteobacteria bacterium]